MDVSVLNDAMTVDDVVEACGDITDLGAVVNEVVVACKVVAVIGDVMPDDIVVACDDVAVLDDFVPGDNVIDSEYSAELRIGRPDKEVACVDVAVLGDVTPDDAIVA